MHLQVDDLASALHSLRPPVLIIPHSNADVDAVASAYGAYRFLSRAGIPSVLFFPSLSATAADLLNRFSVEYTTGADVSGRDVVVVDTSSSSMLPVDVFSARRLVVVDHHVGGDLRGYIFKTPSLSEVVAQLLLRRGIRDERAYALLAAGIYSDTAELSSAGPQTLRTLSECLLLARMDSVADVSRLLDRPMSSSERIARLKALRRLRIYRIGNIVVAVSRAGAYEGSVATELIHAGADLAIVVGNGRVIGRCSEALALDYGIDLVDLFSHAARVHGANWGGHPCAAGMHVENTDSAVSIILERLAQVMKSNGYDPTLREY